MFLDLKRLEIVGHPYGNSGVKENLAYGILLTLPKLESLMITNPEVRLDINCYFFFFSILFVDSKSTFQLSESCISELRKYHHTFTFKTDKSPTDKPKYQFDPQIYDG